MPRNINRDAVDKKERLELNFTAEDLRIIVEALSLYKQIQIEDLKSIIDTRQDQTVPIMKYTRADNISVYIKHKGGNGECQDMNNERRKKKKGQQQPTYEWLHNDPEVKRARQNYDRAIISAIKRYNKKSYEWHEERGREKEKEEEEIK